MPGSNAFEGMVELLLRPKSARRGFVAHLDKVAHGKVSERVGISFASHKIFREGTLTLVRELGQAFVEDNAILESGVHPLPVEGHDGVGGVAEQRDLVLVMPGCTADRDERTGRVLLEVGEQAPA